MNQRKEQILIQLKTLGYLTREQIRRINHLGTVRNANRIMREMQPYVSSFRDGYDTIYYLNREGREFIGASIIRKRTPQAIHHIMKNQFFIFTGMPNEWKNEQKITDGQKVNLVCDALFKKNGLSMYSFLEVDHQQKMAENRNKVEKYKRINESGIFQNHRKYGYFPKLIWLTTNEYRKKKLFEMCKELPCEVYTLDDIR
jgi:Replication-relaxation